MHVNIWQKSINGCITKLHNWAQSCSSFEIFPEVLCNFFVSNNCFCWHQFSSVQSLSRVRLFVTPWTAAHQASLSITNSQSLLKLMSIEMVMPSNHLILCHPLLPPSILPSIRVFYNESVLRIRWSKYWSFSFSPSNEYSGLIYFRIDWFDLLAVQGTLKSLPAPLFKSISSSALGLLYGSSSHIQT